MVVLAWRGLSESHQVLGSHLSKLPTLWRHEQTVQNRMSEFKDLTECWVTLGAKSSQETELVGSRVKMKTYVPACALSLTQPTKRGEATTKK